jgi:lipoprotein-anchoring transpeptidase ErfK/SrfK
MVRFLTATAVFLSLAPPAAAALEYPVPARPRPEPLAIAAPLHPAWLHARPHGARIASVHTTTAFGSPETLAVVQTHGKWLQVISSSLPNDRLGWIRLHDVRLSRTRFSVTVDLSRRVLLVRRDGVVTRRVTVGIGRPGSPTPTGRFAVTDKLSGGAYGAYYGCCILALSAHQPNLPPGWTGGDRVAVHGTNAPSTIGAAASAGCLHAGDADLRVLMRRLPLGTRVTIRT